MPSHLVSSLWSGCPMQRGIGPAKVGTLAPPIGVWASRWSFLEPVGDGATRFLLRAREKAGPRLPASVL